ncbi:MAG: hypothetical protein ACJ77A_17985 [Actinomycetota bacterium]
MELDWREEQFSAKTSLESLMERDPTKFLDAVDFLVHRAGTHGQAVPEMETLDDILEEGGSMWRVAVRDGEPRLERRVEESVASVVEDVVARTGRAGQYLALAWTDLYGRNPNPSGAYREAVKAVEAAAQPILLPQNDRATLGQLIAAVRDAPTKWTVNLKPSQGDPTTDLLGMMQLLWRAEYDRHGTASGEVPLQVGAEEAEAAVHLAATLVHWFHSGTVVRSSPG